MTHSGPLAYLWWLVSRASGVIALVLITLAVLMGLSMAARVLNGARMKRTILRLHEHLALSAVAAIAVHGLSLLGDRWLHPGLEGIAVPMAMHYRPAFTALGIIGGYLAVLVGPSFYVRRRLGAARWRKLHRASVLVWALGAVHTLGSGSDAGRLWLRCIVLLPMVPLAYLLVLRALRGQGRRTAASPAVPGQGRRAAGARSPSASSPPPSAVSAGSPAAEAA